MVSSHAACRQFSHDQLAQLRHKPTFLGRLGGVKQEGFRLADGHQNAFQQRLAASPLRRIVRQRLSDRRHVIRNKMNPPLRLPSPAIPDHFVARIDHLFDVNLSHPYVLAVGAKRR
jgi:hypothetical protein